jgi:hypothetical protein
LPTTAASAASGCTGLLRVFLGGLSSRVGMGQLERAGLGCQTKNQPCLSGLLRAPRRISAVGPGRFIRELIPFGNTHDPTSSKVFKPLGWKTDLTLYEKAVTLNMPHQKLIRVLNYVWLLVVFPVAVAILVGVLGHSVNLGIKTFLLIECGMAVLSPLLNAVISDGNHTHHHRRK